MISRERLIDIAWVIGIFLGVCAVWEATVKLLHLPQFVLPSIEEVLADFVAIPKLYLLHASFTIAATLAGFVVAAT